MVSVVNEANRIKTIEDRKFMRQALSLARKGIGRTSPNPPVGCVLVRSGRVVGRGFHVYDLRDHAEARAIAEAGMGAKGATAYVTLEPCSHYGRTPPCAELLIRSGVRRVVIPMIDPNPKVAGAGVSLLRSAGVSVEVGILAEEACRVIEPFACHALHGRPLVVSKVGMSLDGRIATSSGESRWITSPEGRGFGQDLRLELDAILVGSGTVLADDPELTYRGRAPKARPLLRVILDGRLRISPSARILRSGPSGSSLVFCRKDPPHRKRRALEAAGAEVIPVSAGAAGLDLHRVLEKLAGMGILGVLVEGGSSVHWSFAAAELVDKFYFLIAPIIIGGKHAVPSIGGAGYRSLSSLPRYRFLSRFMAGSDLVLETYPSYSRSILSPWSQS